MKVRAIWEFDADVEDLDEACVDKEGLAKDLARAELGFALTVEQNMTVREFIDEFCDNACESVDIIDEKKRQGYHFDGKDIDTIPENLLKARIKEHILCYNAMHMSHEVCLYIESTAVEEVSNT